jgi:hypothetical protein
MVSGVQQIETYIVELALTDYSSGFQIAIAKIKMYKSQASDQIPE